MCKSEASGSTLGEMDIFLTFHLTNRVSQKRLKNVVRQKQMLHLNI